MKSRGGRMSEINDYMVASVLDYVSGTSRVAEFQAAFAGAYFHIRQRGAQQDSDANQLANRLVGPIAEFAGGHRTEDSLRRELEAVIRPFAEKRFVPKMVS